MSSDLITVVVPVYNIRDDLGKCVDSILAQTHPYLEIILVDDGSRDGSGELCDRYAAADSRIHVIHQENKGVVRARRAGVRAASGSYLTFIDGDDWIEPEMMEYLLSSVGNADLVSSGTLREMKSGLVTRDIDDFAEGLYEGDGFRHVLDNFLYDFSRGMEHPLRTYLCGKLYRADIMRKIPDHADVPPRYYEDLMLLAQYVMRCRSARIAHRCFYHYQCRPSSATNALDDTVLADLDRVYITLKTDMEALGLPELLRPLQKTILMTALYEMSHKMCFPDELFPLNYLLDLSCFRGKRAVIFGAGSCGKDCYRQLLPVCASLEWIASRTKDVFGVPVKHVGMVTEMNYDVILVAMERPQTAEEMRGQLLALGVPDGAIRLYREVRSRESSEVAT